MNVSQQDIKQRIYSEVTQLQIGLEEALNIIFEQAGSRINVEKQAEVQKGIEGTQQRLETFKQKYV